MEEENKEKNIDIKNTMAKMLKEEKPEMTQEEAIMSYKENNQTTSKNSSDDDNTEESEHLKRIKQELLASLERVKQLAKKIYGEDRNKLKKEVREKSQKIKVKGGKKGAETQTQTINKKEEKETERE